MTEEQKELIDILKDVVNKINENDRKLDELEKHITWIYQNIYKINKHINKEL